MTWHLGMADSADDCAGFSWDQQFNYRNAALFPQYPVPATYTKGRPFDWAPSPALAPAPSPTAAALRGTSVTAATAVLGIVVLLLCAALLG